MADLGPHEGAPAMEPYLSILRRRWPVVLLVAALVVGVALAANRSQDKVYAASSDVYLTRFDVSGQLGGLSDLALNQPAQRWIATQAQLARLPAVAIRAVAIAGVPGASPASLLQSSSVAPQPNADLLTFVVRDPQPATAAKLADAYARAFTKYRGDLDVANIERVIGDVERQLVALRKSATSQKSLVASLTGKLAQLRAIRALQTSNVTVVRSAAGAGEVKKSRLASGLAGGALGLALGVGLALLLEVFDRRARSEAEIVRRLDMPLLGRLPSREARWRRPLRLVMLEPSESRHAEAFRLARANIEHAAGDKRSIMLSALEREVDESPAIAANLALALARNSTRTILVDLDVRRGALDRLFGTEDLKGLTEVVADEIDLDAALVTVWGGKTTPVRGGAARPSGRTGGPTLDLLPIGAPPESVGEFVASPRLHGLMKSLREQASLLVIHGPPLLGTADALALTDAVDGLIVIAGVGSARRAVLSSLRGALDGVVDTLGVIVIGTGRATIAPLPQERGRSGPRTALTLGGSSNGGGRISATGQTLIGR